MKKVKTQRTVRLIKVELNDIGDYIEVPVGNDDFFDCFAAGCKQIDGLAKGCCNKLRKIEKKYGKQDDLEADLKKIEETAKVKMQFSKNVTSIIDNIFGEETVRKYFHKFYEEDPDFMPNVECFTDFLNQITPVMKKLYEDSAG